jgi:hypothetical protein
METETKREERAAQNELLFRTVNEQIAAMTDRFASLLSEIDVVCECADPACLGTIRLRTADYGVIRDSQSDFVVLPGHEREDVEGVVRRADRYLVVRKDRDVVAKVDARS